MSEDITDSGLIDVTKLKLNELLPLIDEPALNFAVQRILVSGDDVGSYGFSNRI